MNQPKIPEKIRAINANLIAVPFMVTKIEFYITQNSIGHEFLYGKNVLLAISRAFSNWKCKGVKQTQTAHKQANKANAHNK